MYLLKTGSLHHNLDVCQRTVAMTNLKKKEKKRGIKRISLFQMKMQLQARRLNLISLGKSLA